MRSAGLATGLGAAMLAAATLSLATLAQAAPPPATLQEVVAWADRSLSGVDDLPMLGFNALGITFASPKGAMLRPSGLIEGDIRQEFFEPVELDGQVMRSTTARWTVDCAHQRYAVLRMTLYAGNNLKGQLSERETAPPVWLARDKISEQAIDAMCETAKKGLRLDAPPPPPSR
ncbi:MAG: hypothetical protein KKE02_09535 [Alphaproteobacteria bacterium]|nr:hypothetical protein [Alphaproteobacteria bacterium]MBU1513803.1 hypothetical protein [Alphaproteobacteria bacterium]MBU2094552.1 hypothetical protein [Alphaproteobacteria bacterium]MBU2151248.1 hypothetical protein [Alphaproteobacteria bacterium]MBU2305547.1 hypothetical protein [Alphaproteobacteria bacterium]